MKLVLRNVMDDGQIVARLVCRRSPTGNGQDAHFKTGQTLGKSPPNATIANNGDGLAFECLPHG